MQKLDDNFLNELGLGALPAEEKKKLLSHIFETLEQRVGMKLAANMSDAQLDEFDKLMPRPEDNDQAKAQKEAGALHWLETNVPNYKEVVASELETLKSEIKASAPQILAASSNS